MNNRQQQSHALTEEERKTILGRIFPTGYIKKKDEWRDDDTFLGYTPEGDAIELRFWYECNIDFIFQYPQNMKKYEYINQLVNTALAKDNNHKERKMFDYTSDTQYFVLENNIGFTLCFREKEEKKQTA